MILKRLSKVGPVEHQGLFSENIGVTAPASLSLVGILARRSVASYNDLLTPLGMGHDMLLNTADTQWLILCQPYCQPLGSSLWS